MIGLAALALVFAVLVTGARQAPIRLRLDALTTSADVAAPIPESRSPLRILLAVVVLVVAIAVAGATAGVVVGGLGAVVVATIPPRSRPVLVELTEAAVVVDLIAGCLDAGASMPDAIEAASSLAGPQLRWLCATVASAARAGAPAADAWAPWLADPGLAPVARTAIRTAQTGAAAADDLRQAASRIRHRQRSAAQRRVRQASVWLVLPLGLFFLPAFVLIAVVPVVLGLFPALR